MKLMRKEVNEMNRYRKKGVEVSRFCKWNGKNITRVHLEALTDSNFHTLRKKVARLVNEELNSKLRLEG